MKLADDSGNLKIPFFRLGNWKHPVYGVIEGTQEKFGKLVDNFRKNVLGRPPFVRLGHDKGSAGTFGDTPAEAWVYDIIQEGDVLYALAWPTSQEVVEAVRQKRYRFASPEYAPDYTDKESGTRFGPVLEAIGLTNEPFLTRLPETVVLADPPGTIYLDCEELKEVDKPMPENELLKENNSMLKKLADGFTKFVETFKPGIAGADGLSGADRKKLSEVDELKVKLASMETDLKDSKAKASEAQNTAWASKVETRLAALVASGVPPVMCEQAKTILLANPDMGTTTIKLADNKEITLADQIFATLDALPKEHRVRLAQAGSQESGKPGHVTAKEVYGDVVPELNK